MSFQKYFPIDKELIFRENGQAAVTADGYIGTQKDLRGEVLTEMVMIINVEAIEIDNSDETYTFRVVGSQTADRTDARVLGMCMIGDAAAVPIETVDAAAGDRYEIRFSTEINGENQRYLDLHLDENGTGGSITFSAFASKRQ